MREQRFGRFLPKTALPPVTARCHCLLFQKAGENPVFFGNLQSIFRAKAGLSGQVFLPKTQD
jgi:hypothetical protein